MRAVYSIFKRELRSYFASPTAYIILVVFLLLSGVFFFLYLEGFVESQYDPRYQIYQGQLSLNQSVIAPFFSTINIILLLLVPLITMRLFAEERKNYTAELLFTSPLRAYQIVLGKYFSSLALFLAMLLIGALNIIALSVYGTLDMGPLLSGYLGIFLIGASFISVGMFASSLTDNQVISAVISFGILLLFWVVGASGTDDSLWRQLSIIGHFENFVRGVIEIKDVVYYLTFTLFTLLLTNAVIESERWR